MLSQLDGSHWRWENSPPKLSFTQTYNNGGISHRASAKISYLIGKPNVRLKCNGKSNSYIKDQLMTASHTVSTFQLQLIYNTKYRHYWTWIFLPKPTKFGITQVAICLWFTLTIVIFNRCELCINAYHSVGWFNLDKS